MIAPLVLGFLALARNEEETTVHKYVIETELVSIHDRQSLEAAATFSDIRLTDKGLILRSSSGSGSLLNIKSAVEKNNWAVEFKVKHLMLRDIEMAGIYLWHLEKPLEHGDYKGGSPKFTGFLTGIEFAKDRADTVFAFNYGLDFKNKEMETTKVDHINPVLIENLEELRIKIIHTDKNFKIEIYDEAGNLLSDSFRIREPSIMAENPQEKVFAITTRYNHCPEDVFFELKDLKIFSREETTEYDARHLQSEYNRYPRNKSDDELRLAVAQVDHFLHYLTMILGNGKKNHINEMAVNVKKKLRIMKESIDGASVSLDKYAQQISDSQAKNISTKLTELEAAGEALEKKIGAIAKRLREDQGSGKRRTMNLFKWITLGGMVVFVFAMLRLLAEAMLKRSALSGKKK